MADERTLVPRDYQRAALEHTVSCNTLLSLPTGTGKTFVAVLAVDHYLRVRPDLAVVFIAPTRVLVSQQAAYLREKCASRPKIMELVGREMDSWMQASWDECLKTYNCLVGTPEVFRKALTVTKYLQPCNLSLVVFDECHNAVGNSPMVSIMRQGLWHAPSGPRVLGLTASFAARNLKNPTPSLFQQREHLESVFQASLLSPDVGEDAKGKTNEMEFVRVSYMDDMSGVTLRSEVTEALVELLISAGHSQKYLSNTSGSLMHVLEELGKRALLENCQEGGCLVAARSKSDNTDGHSQRFLAYKHGVLAEKLQDAPAMCHKLRKLLALLKGELSGRRGIVFVRQTVLVQPLTKLLNSELGTPTSPMCVSVTGISLMTEAEQKASMREFRSDKVKLLVSTEATEEGIDVCDCEYVVRYNQFHTTKSHIQGSGRARMQGAKVYYFGNDPTREQALADKMALVAGDNSLAMAEAEMRKRKAEHLARMEFASVHPYRHHSNEINVVNSLTMVFEYCQKHAPNIRVTDCFTFQSGTHLHGCQCIKRFDYPTPTGTWNSVHASEVDKHWGKVNVALILDKTNFPNLKGADRCKRRFLYVVAINLVKQGLLNEHNQPVPKTASRAW
mmetsp:Transcript_12026/g.22810  ORF Transcript_12026/g.22810 Transcript_12026/m.22810 type:complete len:618 (+) Transcript_12026:207-2060(+)